jgi:AcrR family transcriptional regulator
MQRSRRTAPATATPARPVGRPPRISRDDIARAAQEIGLTDLTLKAVADQLGVSVAGLYHHIDGKDDLLRLAAEFSATRAAVPQDRRQHWAIWLLEWAIYNRNIFMSEPAVLAQYVGGAVSAEAVAENVEVILRVLVRQGFTSAEAWQAYSTISWTAIGAAVSALHEQSTITEGRPRLAEYYRVLAQHPDDELVHVRSLATDLATTEPATFVDLVTTVLVGVAVERGDDPAAIRRRIRSAKLTELPVP